MQNCCLLNAGFWFGLDLLFLLFGLFLFILEPHGTNADFFFFLVCLLVGLVFQEKVSLYNSLGYPGTNFVD